MAIFARKYHRTARPTDGVGNVAAVKPHPLLCNPVHVRSGHPRGIVGTQSLLTVIVRENQEDVGPRCSPRGHTQGKQKQDQSHHRIRTPATTGKVKGQIKALLR